MGRPAVHGLTCVDDDIEVESTFRCLFMELYKCASVYWHESRLMHSCVSLHAGLYVYLCAGTYVQHISLDTEMAQ